MIRCRLYSCFLIAFCVVNHIYAQNKNLLFPKCPGIVSYTYRENFQKDVPGTLDIIKNNGITDIEFSNLFGKSAEEMRKLIDERGLYCSSYGVSYEDPQIELKRLPEWQKY